MSIDTWVIDWLTSRKNYKNRTTFEIQADFCLHNESLLFVVRLVLVFFYLFYLIGKINKKLSKNGNGSRKNTFLKISSIYIIGATSTIIGKSNWASGNTIKCFRGINGIFQRNIAIKQNRRNQFSDDLEGDRQSDIRWVATVRPHSPDPNVMELTSMHRSMPELVVNRLRDRLKLIGFHKFT